MGHSSVIRRRSLLRLAGVVLAGGPRLAGEVHAQPTAPQVTLLSAPLELAGNWGGSPPGDAAAVISRTRQVSLTGVRLVSDQQPERLRVDEHTSGPPAIWLHEDPPKTAWIIVDVGALDWCKLAYQFGHELGHVLSNSWGPLAKPAPPSQWLEEALVEAYSLRGLPLLADSWEQNPPFPGDAGFAKSIRQYRADLIEKYRAAHRPARCRSVLSHPLPRLHARQRRSNGFSYCGRDGARSALRRGFGRAQPLAGAKRGSDRRISAALAEKLCRARGLRPFAGLVAHNVGSRLAGPERHAGQFESRNPRQFIV
jgi:hypothetical protein